jgi:hypothetical protein
VADVTDRHRELARDLFARRGRHPVTDWLVIADVAQAIADAEERGPERGGDLPEPWPQMVVEFRQPEWIVSARAEVGTCDRLVDGWRVQLDGRRVAWTPTTSSSSATRPGACSGGRGRSVPAMPRLCPEPVATVDRARRRGICGSRNPAK